MNKALDFKTNEKSIDNEILLFLFPSGFTLINDNDCCDCCDFFNANELSWYSLRISFQCIFLLFFNFSFSHAKQLIAFVLSNKNFSEQVKLNAKSGSVK
jgi:hypothetical protein